MLHAMMWRQGRGDRRAGLARRSVVTGMGAAALAGWRPARAAGMGREIAVGCVFPLTGPAAAIGQESRAGLELAADMINSRPINLSRAGGGRRLGRGGASIRLVFADSRNDPATAASQLIAQESVAALIGDGIGATAARAGIACLTADSLAADRPPHPAAWCFNPFPHEAMFSRAMFACAADLGRRSGRAAKSVALFYEDSPFGRDSSRSQRALAEAAGMRISADIRYRASSASLATEGERLKAANADLLLPSSFTSDAILILRAMHDIGYRPRAIMAQAAGFQEPSFLAVSGALAEGVMSRAAFALDAAAHRPALAAVNRRFRANTGRDLSETAARGFTALGVLADALDRAHADSPAALRAALAATDIAGVRTIMPWRGIRFDAQGQNTLCTPVVQQVFAGRYRTIWPFALATAQAVWLVGLRG